MKYESYITIAVTLKQAIQRHLENRHDCSPTHRKWVRNELHKTIQALRDIRAIGVTY